MTHEDIEVILHEGNPKQLEKLKEWICPVCGKPLNYEYTAEYQSFSYGCECTLTREHGLFSIPACVARYGDSYTF